MSRLLVSYFLLCGVLLGGLSGCANEPTDPPPAEVDIPFRKDGTLDLIRDGETYLTLDIEIADTDSATTRGLMQRQSLPDKSGMLFLFPDESMRSFWMGNTTLSLDIIFLSADQEIVNIVKYTKPLSPENILSTGPAQYVLEVEAGFSDTHGLIASDRIAWRRTE